MRTDERPWIKANDPNPTQIKFPQSRESVDQTDVTVQLIVDNIGKTAARSLDSEWVMEYVTNGDSPEFVYDNRARSFVTTGIVFPHDPFTISVVFMKGKLNSKETEPRYLVPSEFDGLSTGKAYMAVYGKADYSDIWGNKHWLHYCYWFVAPSATTPVTAKACTQYNDTDHN
jgi:hypothetical protein